MAVPTLLPRLLRLAALAFLGIQVAGAQVTVPDTPWDPAIKAFEAGDAAHPPPQGAVLFIGSSSIRRWTSLSQDFPDMSVINRGFGGSELNDATDYVDRIVVPYKPRMIVMYSGDNDLNAFNKTPQQVAEEFREFVAKVHARLPQVHISYIALKPAPCYWARHAADLRLCNRLIHDYILTDKTLAYIDVFTSMLDPAGKPRPELFAPDKLHLAPAGYALWASILRPYLK